MSGFDDGRKSGVYPGQSWRDPQGEAWSVDAIHWDGTERSAFLHAADGTTMRLPAAIVAATFTRAKAAGIEVIEPGRQGCRPDHEVR